MTKAEAALLMDLHPSSSKEHKANKKREKQRRYRQNKSKREAQWRKEERRAMKIRGNTIFYVPNRKEKLRTRRATRRREYRRFMGKMVSELSKKIGRERLRDNRNKTRQHLFTNSSFVNRMAALQKRHKHGFRIQWHAKNTHFGGLKNMTSLQKEKQEHLHMSQMQASTAQRGGL